MGTVKRLHPSVGALCDAALSMMRARMSMLPNTAALASTGYHSVACTGALRGTGHAWLVTSQRRCVTIMSSTRMPKINGSTTTRQDEKAASLLLRTVKLIAACTHAPLGMGICEKLKEVNAARSSDPTHAGHARCC